MLKSHVTHRSFSILFGDLERPSCNVNKNIIRHYIIANFATLFERLERTFVTNNVYICLLISKLSEYIL